MDIISYIISLTLYVLGGMFFYFAARCIYHADEILETGLIVKILDITLFIISMCLFLIEVIALFVIKFGIDWVLIILGIITGIILSFYFINKTNKRPDVLIIKVKKELEKLENELKEINKSNYKTDNQEKAKEILENTIKKLTEQLNEERFKRSINILKKIEEHDNISIKQEVEELQKLSNIEELKGE